jgi:hypothetical protein
VSRMAKPLKHPRRLVLLDPENLDCHKSSHLR